MHCLLLVSLLAVATSAQSSQFASANLEPGPLGPLTGSVLFTQNGSGVTVDLSVSGFPDEGGPWPYHGILHIPTELTFNSP
jgi:hypothetical protein